MTIRGAIAVVGALSALLAVSGPVPPAAASDVGTLGVTVFLAPQDAAGLRTLARARGLAPAARRAQLRRAVPSDLTVARAQDVLRGLGLRVESANRFSLHVTGPAGRVASLFGSTRDRTGAVGQAPLHLPVALVGLASAVVGGDDRPLVLRPATTGPAVDGARARQLYSAPFGPLPPGQPAPGIATVQFSGFDSADLTAFAHARGLPDPVASGQFTAHSVDGADPSAPDALGNDFEVALDQEALLDTAPLADQHAYFAPNGTATGFADAFAAIASDAVTGSNGGATLTAVSVSWGGCEPAWSDQERSATSQALSDVVAAGVTVFAASGDSGAYGCSRASAPTAGLAVDYPASDPVTVAVGGTTVASDNAQSVWFNPSDGSGSGGGYSAVFDRPDYQSNLGSTNARMVPDIALDADPSTGLPMIYHGSADYLGGGTSLASPLAAATFTDLLIEAGLSSGIGDIHRNLYSAPTGAFTDITDGDNGYYPATSGYDEASGLGAPRWTRLKASLVGAPVLTAPATSRSRSIPITVTVPAGMHYDSFSAGVGSPPASCAPPPTATATAPTTVTTGTDGPTSLWVMGHTAAQCFVAEGATLVDSTAPTASMTSPTTRLTLGSSVGVGWTGTDAGTGVASYDVRYARAGYATSFGTPVYPPSWQGVQARTLTMSGLAPGYDYCLSVRARDKAGNLSRWSGPACVAVALDDRALSASTGWGRATSSGYYLGTYTGSTRAGAVLSRPSAQVDRIALVATRCAACGSVGIYLNGTLFKTVSLFASSTLRRQLIVLPAFSLRTTTVSIKVLTAGKTVQIDGLALSRT